MVKAAMDIQYGKDFYKKGSSLPDSLAKEFEEGSPYLLNNYIEVNGRWRKITDPLIKGFVEEQKTHLQRLIDFFGIKKGDKEDKEDRSHMLRARPKAELTEEEVFKWDKDRQVTFLKEKGVKVIPKYEEGRVKKILEMQ